MQISEVSVKVCRVVLPCHAVDAWGGTLLQFEEGASQGVNCDVMQERFTRLPPDQWRSVRTTNAIERLHEEFKRRIKTQTVLPSAETAAMLFWALLASGQINMRKVDGWQTLATKPIDHPIDLAA